MMCRGEFTRCCRRPLAPSVSIATRLRLGHVPLQKRLQRLSRNNGQQYPRYRPRRHQLGDDNDQGTF